MLAGRLSRVRRVRGVTGTIKWAVRLQCPSPSRETTHTQRRTRVGQRRTRAEKHTKGVWSKLLRSCRAALDVFRSIEDGWSASRVLWCVKQCNSLLPSLRPNKTSS